MFLNSTLTTILDAQTAFKVVTEIISRGIGQEFEKNTDDMVKYEIFWTLKNKKMYSFCIQMPQIYEAIIARDVKRVKKLIRQDKAILPNLMPSCRIYIQLSMETYLNPGMTIGDFTVYRVYRTCEDFYKNREFNITEIADSVDIFLGVVFPALQEESEFSEILICQIEKEIKAMNFYNSPMNGIKQQIGCCGISLKLQKKIYTFLDNRIADDDMYIVDEPIYYLEKDLENAIDKKYNYVGIFTNILNKLKMLKEEVDLNKANHIIIDKDMVSEEIGKKYEIDLISEKEIIQCLFDNVNKLKKFAQEQNENAILFEYGQCLAKIYVVLDFLVYDRHMKKVIKEKIKKEFQSSMKNLDTTNIRMENLGYEWPCVGYLWENYREELLEFIEFFSYNVKNDKSIQKRFRFKVSIQKLKKVVGNQIFQYHQGYEFMDMDYIKRLIRCIEIEILKPSFLYRLQKDILLENNEELLMLCCENAFFPQKILAKSIEFARKNQCYKVLPYLLWREKFNAENKGEREI